MKLPLFPLKAVLFPDGLLTLRVFETRYIDMVRDCMHERRPFGVCMIVRGEEVGQPALPETVGCMATIDAWDMQQLGVLQIRARGATRFRIVDSHAGADRLLRADVEPIAPDRDGAVAPEHRACVDLLARLIDDHRRQIEAGSPADADKIGAVRFASPHRMDSAVWVGNRLCEVLPVPLRAKQKLMELDDAYARLNIVSSYLKQHAVIA